MTQEELRQFAEQRGLRWLGPTVVGLWNGYPFVATLKMGRVNVLSASFAFRRGPSGGTLRRGRKQLPQGCTLTWQAARVNLICSGQDETLFQQFQAGMDAVTALFRDTGAVVSTSCPLCGRELCDSLALVNGAYVPVHRACCENRSYQSVSQAEANARTGSYVTGWIGALLGGVVGALPTILVAWLLEIISLYLCLLIPLGAYYGYKLCRGRMDRMATVATIVSSLLQVFVVEQALFYIAIVQYMGLWPSVFASVGFYFEIMEPGDILPSLLQNLLFVAVGIFCVFGIIRRTNQNVAQDAGILLASLTDREGRPWPAAEPAPSAARPASGESAAWTAAPSEPAAAETPADHAPASAEDMDRDDEPTAWMPSQPAEPTTKDESSGEM